MKKDYTEFLESLGFHGCTFTKFLGKKQACQLEYESCDYKKIRKNIGKAKQHDAERSVFLFIPHKGQAIRVNTRIQRVWLGNGRAMVRKFKESV